MDSGKTGSFYYPWWLGILAVEDFTPKERRPELQREQRRRRPVRSSSGPYKARDWINTEIMRNRFEQSFKLFFLTCIFEFMINTAPQGSNKFNGTFFAEGSWGAGSNPGGVTSRFFFFFRSSYFYSLVCFSLFYLITLFSFARFFAIKYLQQDSVIGQQASCLSNWTVCAIAHAQLMAFFVTAAKKNLGISCNLILKSLKYHKFCYSYD